MTGCRRKVNEGGIETEWSKKEKLIAHKAFDAAYEHECMAIAQKVSEMTMGINEPSDIWEIHDYLAKKRKEIDRKYDYRYSVLLSVFARLICEGWIKEEDLEGLSGDKMKEIRRIAEFFAGS